MSKKFARRDANHSEIVNYLRSLGCFVHDISELKNCADIVVLYKGRIFYGEIKDGTKPLSQRKLTEGEIAFKNEIEKYGGLYFVIESKEDVLKIIQQL